MRNLEELKLAFDRLQAIDDCRNLMSRYIYLHNMERHREYAVELWSHREDCRLQMPWGRYDGWEGVAECYLKDHGDACGPHHVLHPSAGHRSHRGGSRRQNRKGLLAELRS